MVEIAIVHSRCRCVFEAAVLGVARCLLAEAQGLQHVGFDFARLHELALSVVGAGLLGSSQFFFPLSNRARNICIC